MGTGAGFLKESNLALIAPVLIYNHDPDNNFDLVLWSLKKCLTCWNEMVSQTVTTNTDGIGFLSKFAAHAKQTDPSGFVSSVLNVSRRHGNKRLFVLIKFLFGMANKTETVVR